MVFGVVLAVLWCHWVVNSLSWVVRAHGGVLLGVVLGCSVGSLCVLRVLPWKLILEESPAASVKVVGKIKRTGAADCLCTIE